VEATGLNEEEMTLVIKRFKTAFKRRKKYPNKSKSRKKRSCFKCGKYGDFIAQCLDNENDQEQEKMEEEEEKDRTTGRQRVRLPLARSGTQTAVHLTLTMRDLLPPHSTCPPTSPTSDTLASWPRRRRYVHEILLSTLLLVMRILMMR
jgi:hypothetical protein